MKSKVMSAEQAVSRIKDGAHVMVGGFLKGGTPESTVRELIRQGQKDLTVTSNDTGRPDCAVFDLVASGHVTAINASYIGANPETGRLLMEHPDKVTLYPQGTLAEKIRCGGFGLGGVLTPVGLGTIVENGKRVLEVDGKAYLLETALRADVALIRAHVADTSGNLFIRGTSKNFNVVMAVAADYVVAEADEIVPIGGIDPEDVTVPGALVDALVPGGGKQP
jgi:acetate CoA/acetoacetate CoA-transferase alpha subunit